MVEGRGYRFDAIRSTVHQEVGCYSVDSEYDFFPSPPILTSCTSLILTIPILTSSSSAPAYTYLLKDDYDGDWEQHGGKYSTRL